MHPKVLLRILLQEQFHLISEESEAATQAHKLGLTHSGWKYWKNSSGQTVAQTVKGKLVSYSGPEPTDKGDGTSSVVGKEEHNDALGQLTTFAMAHANIDEKYEMEVRDAIIKAITGNDWQEHSDLDALENHQYEELVGILDMYKNSKHSKPINAIRNKYKKDAEEKAAKDAEALADRFNDEDAPAATQKFFADPQMQGTFSKYDDNILMQAAAFVPSANAFEAMAHAQEIADLLSLHPSKALVQFLYNKLVDANGLLDEPVEPTNKFSDPEAPPAVQKFFAMDNIQHFCMDCTNDELANIAAASFALTTPEQINIAAMKIAQILTHGDYKALGATAHSAIIKALYDANGVSPAVQNKPAETPPMVQPVPLAPENKFDPKYALSLVGIQHINKKKLSPKEQDLLWKYLQKLDQAQTTMDVYNVGTALKKHKLVDPEGWKAILKYHKDSTVVAKYEPGMKKGSISTPSIESLPDAPADYMEPELKTFDAYTPEQKDWGAKVFEYFEGEYDAPFNNLVAPEHQKEVSERIMAALFTNSTSMDDVAKILQPLLDNEVLEFTPYSDLLASVNMTREDIVKHPIESPDTDIDQGEDPEYDEMAAAYEPQEVDDGEFNNAAHVAQLDKYYSPETLAQLEDVYDNALAAWDWKTAKMNFEQGLEDINMGANYVGMEQLKLQLEKDFKPSGPGANKPVDISNMTIAQTIEHNVKVADKVLDAAGMITHTFPTYQKQIVAKALQAADAYDANEILAKDLMKHVPASTFHKICAAVENAHTIKQFPQGVGMQDVDDIVMMSGDSSEDYTSAAKITIAQLIHGLPYDVMLAKIQDLQNAGYDANKISQNIANWKQSKGLLGVDPDAHDNAPDYESDNDIAHDVIQMGGLNISDFSHEQKFAIELLTSKYPQEKIKGLDFLHNTLDNNTIDKIIQGVGKYNNAIETLGGDEEDNTDIDDLEAQYPVAADVLSDVGISINDYDPTVLQGIEYAFDASDYNDGIDLLKKAYGDNGDVPPTSVVVALKTHFGEDASDPFNPKTDAQSGNDAKADALYTGFDFLNANGIGPDMWSLEDKIALGKALQSVGGDGVGTIITNLDGYKALTGQIKTNFVQAIIDKIETNKKNATPPLSAPIEDIDTFIKNAGLSSLSAFSPHAQENIKAAFAATTWPEAKKIINSFANGLGYSAHTQETLLDAFIEKFKKMSASTTPPAATSGMLPVPGAAPETIEKEIPQAAQKAASTLMDKFSKSGKGVEEAKVWATKKLKEKEQQETDSEMGKSKKIKDIENFKNILLALDKYHGGSHLAGLTPEMKTKLDNVSYDLLTNYGMPVESDEIKQAITVALGATDYNGVVDTLDEIGKELSIDVSDLIKAVADELGMVPTEKVAEPEPMAVNYDALLDDVGLGNIASLQKQYIENFVHSYLKNPAKDPLAWNKLAEQLPKVDANKIYALGQQIDGMLNKNKPVEKSMALSVNGLTQMFGIKVPVDALSWMQKYLDMAVNAKTSDDLIMALHNLKGIGNIDEKKLIDIKNAIIASNPNLQKVDVSKLTALQAHEQNAVKTFFDKFPMQHKTAEERKKVESLIKSAANTKSYQDMKAVLQKGMDNGLIGIDEFNALKGVSGIMANSYNKIQAELTATQKAEQLKQVALAQEEQAKKEYLALPEKSKKAIQNAIASLNKDTGGAYQNLAQAHKNLVNNAILTGVAAGDTIGIEHAFGGVAGLTGLPAGAVNVIKGNLIDAALGIAPYTPTSEPATSTPIPDRVNNVIAKWTGDTGFGKGQLPHAERTALEAVVQKALEVPAHQVNSTISALYTSTSLLDSQIEDMRVRIQQERQKPSGAYVAPMMKKAALPAPKPIVKPWETPDAPYGMTPKGKPKKAPKAVDSIGKKMVQLGVDSMKYPELKKNLSDIINTYVAEKNAGTWGAEGNARYKANQMMMNMGINYGERKKMAAFVKANVKKGNLFNYDGNLDMAASVAKKAATPTPAVPQINLSNVADPYGIIQNEIIPGETLVHEPDFKIKGGTQTPSHIKEALGQASILWRKKNLSPQMQADFTKARSGWQNSSQWGKSASVRRFMNRTYTKMCDGPPPCIEEMGGELRRGMGMSANDFIEFAKAFKIGSKVYLGPSGFSANFATASNFSGGGYGGDTVKVILRAVPNKSGKLKAARLYGDSGYDSEAEIVLGTSQNMNVLQVIKHIYGQGNQKGVAYEIVMRPDNPDGTNESLQMPEQEGKLGFKTGLWDTAGLSKITQALLIKYMNSSVHTKY